MNVYKKFLLWVVLGLTTICLPSLALGQQAVLNISPIIWEKLPEGYSFYNCGLEQKSPSTSRFISCELYIASTKQEDPESNSPAFFWVAPIQPDGNIGQGLLAASKTTSGHSWVGALALGAKNNLLAIDDEKVSNVAVLGFPSSGVSYQPIQFPILWQYKVPKAAGQGTYSVIQALGTSDGGYVLMLQDFSEEAANQGRTSLLLVKLDEGGQGVWSYSYTVNPSQQQRMAGDGNGPALLDRNFFVTADQKIVLHAFLDEFDNQSGTAFICLNSEGQSLANHFVAEAYWFQNINWVDGSFGFVNFLYDQEKERSYLTVSIFDQNCQRQQDYQLNFPAHGIKENTHYDIKSSVVLPNGNLAIIYVQETFPGEGDNPENMPLPRMYMAEFSKNFELVRDTPLIADDNPDRAYLVAYTEGEEGMHPLKVTTILSPDQKEVWALIHNMGLLVDEENIELKDLFLRPRLYRVLVH